MSYVTKQIIMFKFKGLFAQSSMVSKLMLLLGATCIFTIFGLATWLIFSHGNMTDINSLKWGQLLQSIGMFVIPPFAVAYLWSEKPLNFLNLDRKTNWLDVSFVVLFMIIIIPFINLLGDLNHQLILPKALAGIENWMKTSETQATQFTEKLLNVKNVQGLLFNIFLIAIIPALGEELFFRGALQGVLKEWRNVKLAIWITAIIFSAIHLQFYGFVPRMLLGAFFGYLLFWSENIWLPIAAHFVNNVLAVIFYYFKFNGYQLPDIDTIGTGNTLWLGIASGALAIFGFFQIKKRFQLRNG